MTPWGVITIGASWEARMPGAPGLQGAEEARGGKVRASLSQVGGQGLRRGKWGSFAIPLFLTPHSPGSQSLSKLHPICAHFSPPHRPTLVQTAIVSPPDPCVPSSLPTWLPTLFSTCCEKNLPKS